MLGPELEPRVSARAAELRVEGQNQNKAESEQGKVLPPGRKESCRRGGESPAAGEVRVLPPGRKESCCRREEKEREPPYKRERARAALRGKERGNMGRMEKRMPESVCAG